MPGRLFPKHSLFLGLLVLLVGPLVARGSLVVSEWRLVTRVQDLSGISVVQDSAGFGVVENPFQAVGNAAVGPNTATTAYDFSWTGDSGSFDIATTQRVETFRVRTISSGFIFIAPTADLRMTIDASLDFASVPGDLADVRFSMFVFDEGNPFVPVFFESLRGGNLTLEPAVGTLAFSGDVILPAGATYSISFRASNDNGADTNNPTGPITSSGFFHFAFQPIPEPATAHLIAFGALTLRQPRRRRR